MGSVAFKLPQDFRRNFLVLLADYIGFGVALSFVSVTIVLPAFVRELTDSEPVIGLITTIFNAGWLLPQLGVAAALSGKQRLKPYMMVATTLSRSLFLVLAVVTWLGLPQYPQSMLVVFFICIGSFTLLDSVASLAWFDILARAIPLARRGRLVGAGQVVSGLLGVAAGGAVSAILDSSSIAFPNNFALLFAISAAVHIPSVLALALLKEPKGEVEPDQEPEQTRNIRQHLSTVWQGDRRFRRLMIVRWLTGLMALSYTFYILHATDVIGLPPSITGWFIAAERIGSIIASLGFGWLSEKRGPRHVIWIGSLSTLLSPLLALLIHYVRALPPQTYVLVLFFLGVTNGSYMLGLFNYLLEMAPTGKRPIYLGLSNTLEGALVPAAFLGGVLLRATSYPVLFGITSIGVMMGTVMSLRLDKLSIEKT